MRLIDADALGKRITKRLRKKGSFEGKEITELGYAILCIHEAETVDAEPIRHGHWVKENEEDNLFRFCVYISVFLLSFLIFG